MRWSQRFPARHYVMVDDKLRVLTAMKEVLGCETHDRLSAPGSLRTRHRDASPSYPAADITVERIGDLLQRGLLMKPTQQLHDLGQSLWLDNITRGLLDETARSPDTSAISR